MKPLQDLAVLAAAVSESSSAISLLRGGGALALILHVASSACVAALLHRRLLEKTSAWGFALILAAAVFVPFLGTAGMIAVALATPAGASAADPDCVEVRIPRPAESADPRPSPDGDSPGVSRRARIAALTALRSRSDPGAVALLRAALEDRDEDVRLLAHALLESRSRAAWRGIEATATALERAPEPRCATLHQRLAAQYWELAWAGLVQGECLDHALAMARRHALAALERHPDCASLHFLLARIELRLGSADRAEPALIRARELGVPASVAAPYLAEAAFLRRRFEMVRTHLASAGKLASSGAGARVRRYWS